MGCDIHLYQEKRVNGRWVAADAWEPSPYEDDPPGAVRVPYEKALYHNRNYKLFAVLADVRNGYGFAGVPTGSKVRPIAQPRGVPGDCSVEYRKEVDAWGEDGHSHSWVTLADIERYDWNLPRQNRGCVPIATYRAWKANGSVEPDSYCGMVSGPGIKIISETDAQDLHKDVDNERIYVDAWWPSVIRGDCEDFLDRVRPRLQQLEAECGKGNARLVFFFDN